MSRQLATLAETWIWCYRGSEMHDVSHRKLDARFSCVGELCRPINAICYQERGLEEVNERLDPFSCTEERLVL